jgi:putative ABC transport system permease protein
VVKNFITGSPFHDIAPMVIQGPKNYWFGAVTMRLNGKLSTNASLKKVEEIFHAFNPDYLFAHYFVEDVNAEKFEEQQHTGTQAAIFGGLSIFISCLGLFALATYVSESRNKEMGIRKVLGASSPAIAILLIKEFAKPVAISFLIASSISWWAMNKWLQGFSNRIDIGYWVFAVTGLLTVLIVTLTVGHQSIKAALANPVKSLRTE